ncbi:MAG: alpha-xylosidase [Treponema sp.]|nr:alpha-xylosidase [Treponema sp.]
MKFRDGYWLIKKGLHHISSQEFFEAEAGEKELFLYSNAKKITQRGDTLNLPLLTTIVSSPMPDIIHVKTFRHKGGMSLPPSFDLAPDVLTGEGSGARIQEKDGLWAFNAGALRAELDSKGKFNLCFKRDGKKLLNSIGKLSGHFSDPEGKTSMVQYLDLGVGETIYGFGERFTPFVKNGQTVESWNEDGGTSSEQAYKSIPFFISSAGYGVLVNNPGKVSFEIASEVVSAVQFSVPGEIMDYYIISGENLKNVMRNYCSLCGFPALPPAWSFGLWLSTSFTTKYDEKTVAGFIDGMAERNIPLSVFHFDCFWMKAFQWVDFEWDKSQFPNPPEMLKRLKKRGLRISMWINPYIAQKSCLFDEGMEKGYLVKKSNGDIWQWDLWQAGMALVDFTNPEAAAWYQKKLKKLLDMGVDTFKSDFGERIPLDVVWHNGEDSEKMHNFYSYLYNKTVFDLLEETRGKGEALVFARSATLGCQRFPVHWGGDCSASYESMAETLRGGLSLGLSGFGFWSHDIGGFENTATPDLFKRWTAFGLLSSHSRLHGNESYRVPWNFDEEACEVLRFFTELKFALMPYLYRGALEAHEEGIPVMRAMILEFPDDPACAYLDRQYMLGGNLLAAPVFNENGEVEYYLPGGKWTNIISGNVAGGGSWQKEKHGYFSLPLMVRPNSILALGRNCSQPDYDYTDAICFHVFELGQGETASFEICSTRGTIEGKLVITREKNKITVQRSGINKPWSLCLRNIHRFKNAGNLKPKDNKEGLFFDINGDMNSIIIELE